MIEKISNSKTFVKFSEKEKCISGGDKEDKNNYPMFYSISKRGIKKAWGILKIEFNDEMTMFDVMRVLSKTNIRARSYCGMD